jgi:hypothetical protein
LAGGIAPTRRPSAVALLASVASGETDLGRRRYCPVVRRLIRNASLAAAVAVVVLSLSVTAVFAGEVKGPWTGSPSTNVTAAPAHANSICAFSGLNDNINGQTASRVQTAADSFKYYGLPHGTPGQACRGGSNPDNP